MNTPTLVAVTRNNMQVLQVSKHWDVTTLAHVPECRVWQAGGQLDAAGQNATPEDFSRAWLTRGRLAWLAGDCEQAKQDWSRASELASDDDIARLLYSVSLASEDNAADWTTNLRPLEVRSFGLLVSHSMEQGGDQEAAAKWLASVQKSYPELVTANHLSDLYLATGQQAAAAEMWAAFAAVVDESEAAHWWASGRAAELGNNWEQAIASYKRGAELSSTPYDFYIQLASVYALSDLQQAEQAYLEALALRPDLIWAYLGLGHVALNRSDFDKAREWYSQAEQLDPGNLSPKYYLGYVEYYQQHYLAGIPYFRQVLQIDPAHYPSMYYLAQCEYHTGEIEAAQQQLAAAINGNPAKPWQWAVELGDWQVQATQYQEARESYLLAASWSPNNPEIEDRLEKLDALTK